MATFAISDIHGRLNELESLLEYIQCSPADNIIFLGDYIDRGPDSNAVIEKLISLEAMLPNVSFLKGNHEEMAITSRGKDNLIKQWMKYGGDKTMASYPDGVPDVHWEFMQRLLPYVETQDAIFVHAALEEHLAMQDQAYEVLIWKRLTKPLHHHTAKKIVCGHSTRKTGFPVILGSARCIDCAGWLTAINVDTDHIYQVDDKNCKREYELNEVG